MAIAIRQLAPSDGEIAAFIESRLSEEWRVPKEEVRNEYIEPSFHGGFPYIFVAFADGAFAGKIFLSIEKNWFLGIDGEPWISAVYTAEKFRGQGIARALVARAEETARMHGFKKLYLDTKNAAGYYEKLGGWETLGTDTWKGETVTIMAKNL